MRKREFVLLAVAFLTLAGLGACSSEPAEELAAARAAIDEARAAEAETYAPEQMDEMTQKLRDAEAAVQAENEKFALFRDYEAANSALAEVREGAQEAVQTANTEKERVRQEAEQALVEAEAALNSAQTALENAPRGKGTRADIAALNADLEAVRSALESARQAIQAGQYMQAKNQITSAKSQAESVENEIEQALSRSGRS